MWLALYKVISTMMFNQNCIFGGDRQYIHPYMPTQTPEKITSAMAITRLNAHFT